MTPEEYKASWQAWESERIELPTGGNWVVAWHPDVPTGVVRIKSDRGLREWRERTWSLFPSSPIILDMSHELESLRRGAARDGLALAIDATGPRLLVCTHCPKRWPCRHHDSQDVVADLTASFVNAVNAHVAEPTPFPVTSRDEAVIALFARSAVEMIMAEPIEAKIEEAFLKAARASIDYLRRR